MKCAVSWSSITRVKSIKDPTQADVFVYLGKAPVPGGWYLPPSEWRQGGSASTNGPGVGAYLAVCTAQPVKNLAPQEVVVLVQNGLLTHLVVIASPFDYPWMGKGDPFAHYRWAMAIGLRSEQDAARWGEVLSSANVDPQQVPLAGGSYVQIEAHAGIRSERQPALQRALWKAFGLSDFPLYIDLDDPGRLLGQTGYSGS
jgi:hypothetical protein